jgi:hypothetical protein
MVVHVDGHCPNFRGSELIGMTVYLDSVALVFWILQNRRYGEARSRRVLVAQSLT